jgi:transposase-like protein
MATRSEVELRKIAIHRYIEIGEKPNEIYQDLGRSKEWFFKWLKRFRSGDPHWFRDRSKRPYRQVNRTPAEIERRIVQIRVSLQQNPYAQIGANAINWQLHRRGLPSVPVSTINRVLKRHNLISKKRTYQAKGRPYPDRASLGPNNIHQIDLVGPRFIKHDGRFYCLNVMDVNTHRVKLNPCRRKQDISIAQGLIDSWKYLGLPDFVQMDNELSFRGSNRYPHSFGLVIRLCLSLDIQPLFIPMGEPWRNPEIESFQNTFDKTFFRSQRFSSYEGLCREAQLFERFHNENYVYSCLKGKTPNATLDDTAISRLPEDFEVPRKIPIEDGCIHLIRFIRSDQILNVFGEKFLVHKDLIYEYVVATICTDIHQLQLRHDGKLAHCFDYHIPRPFT